MTSRTLVVTGVNGFVGAHVARVAASDGYRVWGTGREREPRKEVAPYCDAYFSADLAAGWPVPAEADAVIHLAGLAAVGPSFAEPQLYLTVNSSIMTTMSEALLTQERRPRVVVVSSGAVYAPPRRTEPLSEQSPTRPNSPYSVAKLLVELQSEYYATRGLDTVTVRPFNHIGPMQGTGFLIPDLIGALRSLGAGRPLPVGSLETARDYTDVRDVAAAYVTLAFAPHHEHSVYNVASGEAHSGCLLYTSPSPRDKRQSRMPSSA